MASFSPLGSDRPCVGTWARVWSGRPHCEGVGAHLALCGRSDHMIIYWSVFTNLYVDTGKIACHIMR